MLRSRYGYVPGQFADFVDWLDAGGRVMLAQAEAVRAAAAYHRAGMDFADALHIAQTDGESFLTLDKTLWRKAGKPQEKISTKIISNDYDFFGFCCSLCVGSMLFNTTHFHGFFTACSSQIWATDFLGHTA